MTSSSSDVGPLPEILEQYSFFDFFPKSGAYPAKNFTQQLIRVRQTIDCQAFLVYSYRWPKRLNRSFRLANVLSIFHLTEDPIVLLALGLDHWQMAG